MPRLSFLGPRASLYAAVVKAFSMLGTGRTHPVEGLPYPEYAIGELLGTKRAMHMLSKQKQDLRMIAPEAFKGVKASDRPLLDIQVMFTEPDMVYSPKRRTMEVPGNILTRTKPVAAPEEVLEKPLLGHEVRHDIQNQLGQVKKSILPSERLVLELDANKFAELVRRRSEGKISHEDLPEDYKKYILGLTGALGLGSALAPEEAEASPLKHVGRAIMRTTKGAQSSAAQRLVGTEIPEYGVIKNVVKGKGDWRYLQFESGKEVPVTKDVIHDLARHAGTVGKMAELAEKDEPSRLAQAITSLKYHRARQDMFHTKASKEDWLKQHQNQLKQLGLEPEPYVWVASEKTFMPKQYVDILKAAGEIK